MTAPSSAPGQLSIDEQDIAAVEAVLRRIDARNEKAYLESFANWKLALGVFKEFELRFALAKDRSRLQEVHRTTLTSLLGQTEKLEILSRRIPSGDLERIGLSAAAVNANLKIPSQQISAVVRDCRSQNN